MQSHTRKPLKKSQKLETGNRGKESAKPKKRKKIKKLENGKKICYNVKQLKNKISNFKLESDIKKYTDVRNIFGELSTSVYYDLNGYIFIISQIKEKVNKKIQSLANW